MLLYNTFMFLQKNMPHPVKNIKQKKHKFNYAFYSFLNNNSMLTSRATEMS